MKVTCEPKGVQIMNKGNKLANASITLDDAFVIRNLSVMNGPRGVFVSMPSLKGIDKDGNTAYYDTAFPLNGELRAEINDVVLNAYQQKLNELQQGAQTRSNDYQQGQQNADPNQAEDDQCDYGF
ncbi:MAG: septation protein SpoVG family protein [Oscillospiraceae bacterium]